MLRGFRHRLFLLLHALVAISGIVAWVVYPDAGGAILVCVAGSMLATWICDRLAARYVRSTLGQLRRSAEKLGRGQLETSLEAQPGDDLYKFVNAINLIASRLSESAAEEQRLHEELRRRERLAFLGELAATVAHEVNNPLDGLQNCVRILRRSQGDPRRVAQMLDLIDSGLTRIELIVRRLLTLASEHVIRPEKVRLGDVIHSAIEIAQTRLDAAEVSVRVECRVADDTAAVDPPLLAQVFVNLLTNAADSMAAGGVIDVAIKPAAGAARRRPERLVVSVADRGAGIAEEVRPHIFEPFYTTKQGGRGSGLGLALVTRIVDAHEGDVDVMPREGGGTVFTVSLPTHLQSIVGGRAGEADGHDASVATNPATTAE